MTDGDFVYRLVSEKEKYERGDQVQVYGELEYIGEKDEITIGHAASAFYFPMKELTRDYNISYAMNEPYITTKLKRASHCGNITKSAAVTIAGTTKGTRISSIR